MALRIANVERLVAILVAGVLKHLRLRLEAVASRP
jgi:hypothetical protein